MRKLLILIGVVLVMVLTTCRKEYDYTTVGFWVNDSSELPVYVNIGHNNLIDTIKVAHSSKPDCDSCYVTIDLISDNTYQVIMYGKTKTFEREIHVPEDGCNEALC